MKTLKIIQSSLLTCVGFALLIPALFMLQEIKEAYANGDYYMFLMETTKLVCGILYLAGAHYVWFNGKKSLYTLFGSAFILIASFAAYLLIMLLGKETYHLNALTEVLTRVAFPLLMIELGMYMHKHTTFFYQLSRI